MATNSYQCGWAHDPIGMLEQIVHTVVASDKDEDMKVLSVEIDQAPVKSARYPYEFCDEEPRIQGDKIKVTIRRTRLMRVQPTPTLYNTCALNAEAQRLMGV